MTCIVAIIDSGKVHMGADSAGIDGYDLMLRKDPKIYKVNEFIFGFTSSFRMGQLLGYKFVPPEHSLKINDSRYMNTVFIDGIRQTLKDGGFSSTTNGNESGGEFLVGYRGQIFRICNDFQVGESIQPFDAVGCGSAYALGAMDATSGLNVTERLKIALSTAEKFSAGVRSPFLYESM